RSKSSGDAQVAVLRTLLLAGIEHAGGGGQPAGGLGRGAATLSEGDAEPERRPCRGGETLLGEERRVGTLEPCRRLGRASNEKRRASEEFEVVGAQVRIDRSAGQGGEGIAPRAR